MKDQSFRGFLLSSAVLGLAIIALAWSAQKILPEKSFGSVYFIVPTVMVITLLFHYALMNASQKTPRSFVGKFMVFSGVKLLLYMIVILVYVFMVKKEIVSFLLIFFLAYLCYTIMEIASILKFLKKISS